MVTDLEKVLCDDVVETAIQRLQAGPHLQRYKRVQRQFCEYHSPGFNLAVQALTACIMGMISAFLDMYKSCMKGRKGARLLTFSRGGWSIFMTIQNLLK